MKYKKLEDLEEGLSGEPTLNLRDILAPYVYRWPVFVIASMLTVFFAFIYLRYAKPVFQVDSMLLIKDEKNGGSNNEILNQLDLFSSSKIVDNEIDILKSKTLMREVVNRLHLDVTLKSEGRVIAVDVYNNKPVVIKILEIKRSCYGRPYTLSFPNSKTFLLQDPATEETFKGELGKLQQNKLGSFIISATPYLRNNLKNDFQVIFLNPEGVVAQYVSLLSIEPSSKQSTVLRISLNSTVPERGRDIVNTLIAVYNEASLKDKNQTVKNSIDFINERLKLITVELTDVEKNVEDFKSTQGLTDISGEASLFLESVRTTDAQLNEVNLKLGVIRNIRRSINEGFKEQKLPSTLGIDDRVLVEQISQLYALELQKVNLLATLPASNPVFKPIDEQIKNFKSNITSSLDGLENTLENMRKGLTNYNSRYESSIKKIPGQEREFITIKRQQSIKENLYLFLLQKKEEAILSYASAAADTRVVEPASVSLGPISPKRNTILLGALAAGLLLAFLYVFIKELLNNRVRSVKDVKRLTEVPLLGEIAQQEANELITVNNRSAMAEQLRSMRINLQYLGGRKGKESKGVVTLLTSSMSGEGKSFVACNLAAVHAISGKKTVILELDLRKPKVSRYLNLKSNIGLSNYLIGKAEIEKIIQPLDGYTNISVIGSGPLPPNPSELLAGEEMEVLINYLKEHYDEIIIDTPPIGLVIDAQILARFADITLFLVRQGITFKSQLSKISELQQEQKFPKMNVVLNGVKLGENYGYGYYTSDAHKGNMLISFFRVFKKRLI
ncbi:GumC family protein [Desertivirga xinjiangensis]|uniref:GumC family protein n=1 Tax=Desertivirga xinjiangensis TaxID=539206 RepID=UPI00210891C8|nr:polysaccharide biosynthesis tyrosine autokinase [Pedobacter xinjiangensis]